MVKVLVLTRLFRGVPMGYGSEFEKQGCEIKTIISEVECSRWNFLYRVRKRLGLSNEKYMIRKDKMFAKLVCDTCESFSPDIIYVCHGTQLRADTVNLLKEKYYVVVDLIDRLEFFPSLINYVGHYHMVYSYIKADCEYLQNKKINCKYLPAVGNPDVFFPIEIEKDIDICFVGATYPEKFYGDRVQIINRLITDFPDCRIFVGGSCAPLRRPIKFVRWFFNRRYRTIYNNRDIDSVECNMIYNRSKICLNINRINTGEGWSERFGNIMFAGSFQIATYNKAIEETFGKMVETFKSYEELRNKIRHYLSNYQLLNEKAQDGHILYQQKVNELREKLDVVSDVLDGYTKFKKV